MGRIGRLLCRRLIGIPGVELVAVNDIMDSANLAYLLRYDSVYGTLPGSFSYRDGLMSVNERSFSVLREENASRLPWAALGVDIVLECSGKYSNRAAAEMHLTAGAGKVLLSTTGSSDIPLLIYGFNQHALAGAGPIISPGGCMTNCATHILYLLNSIGIESAHLNILHSYTSRQGLVDVPHPQFSKRPGPRRESIIPVEIDLAASLERLLPAPQGPGSPRCRQAGARGQWGSRGFYGAIEDEDQCPGDQFPFQNIVGSMSSVLDPRIQ